MKPYYSAEGITLYHGDARQVLFHLEKPRRRVFAITDPPWPGCDIVSGGLDPYLLFADVCVELERLAERLGVWLGVASDPRFLAAVPRVFGFFRPVRLRYPVALKAGKLLNDGDRCYLFSKPGHKSRRGNGGPSARWGDLGPGTLPGSFLDGTRARPTDHPCPRRIGHAKFLIQTYTLPTDIILDPFVGTGTLLYAAKELGRTAIGVELEERWCEETVARLSQQVLFPAEEASHA